MATVQKNIRNTDLAVQPSAAKIIRADAHEFGFLSKLDRKNVTHNPSMSFGAKGLLAHLLSYAPDERILLSQLGRYAANGDRSIATLVRELKRLGHLHLRRVRLENGDFDWSIVVSEVPQKGQIVILPEVVVSDEQMQKVAAANSIDPDVLAASLSELGIVIAEKEPQKEQPEPLNTEGVVKQFLQKLVTDAAVADRYVKAYGAYGAKAEHITRMAVVFAEHLAQKSLLKKHTQFESFADHFHYWAAKKVTYKKSYLSIVGETENNVTPQNTNNKKANITNKAAENAAAALLLEEYNAVLEIPITAETTYETYCNICTKKADVLTRIMRTDTGTLISAGQKEEWHSVLAALRSFLGRTESQKRTAFFGRQKREFPNEFKNLEL